MTNIILSVLSILVISLIAAIISYNKFISQRTTTQESLSEIDVELKRRHDLIPNLVSTVQGYANFEKSTLVNLVNARTMAVSQSGADLASRAHSEDALSVATKGLLAVAENYPELKASANFQKLQTELANTEDRIAASRRFYNSNVREYNKRVVSFPSSILAGWFHFTSMEFFQAETGDEVKPAVAF